MLMRHEKLSSWVQADYFSTWTVQQKLVDDWFRNDHEPEADYDEEPDLDPEHDTDWEDASEGPDTRHTTDSSPKDEREARRSAVTALLDEFRDDPLGDRRPTGPEHAELIRLTQELLHTLDDEEAHRRARATLSRLLWDPLDHRIDLRTRTHRLEFMLLLAVLQHRLDALTDLWPLVEARLNLEATDNQLSRRPPMDFSPLVPESPMGNILGFQFLTEEEPGAAPGSGSPILRFFRCAGVGRTLLLTLHEMTGPGDTAAPHVLLMSGTSWAGTAPGAHVSAPVGAILRAPAKESQAIRRTTFRKLFLRGPDGKPLHLSGTRPDRRPKVLELMLDRLARPRDGRAKNDLDQELDLITHQHRKRLLLLVGSYEEARIAAEFLHGIPRWHGKVCRLVADDVELEVSFGGATPDTSDFPRTDDEPMVLRRGDVERFATTGAEILIAPLLSVERGHNILNDLGQAAIGSVSSSPARTRGPTTSTWPCRASTAGSRVSCRRTGPSTRWSSRRRAWMPPDAPFAARPAGTGADSSPARWPGGRCPTRRRRPSPGTGPSSCGRSSAGLCAAGCRPAWCSSTPSSPSARPPGAAPTPSAPAYWPACCTSWSPT